ncbi:50S ribosomal protein L17 [Parcubacteria bacterium DG_74_2]|nr:MAG: 50S ribosomal protein L17 [Parcubacteria bacterium DG_74_2]
MRKQKKGRKFSRKKDQRKALLKALIGAVVLREKIKTTEAKAKEAQCFVEKYITKAKKGDLVCRRLLVRYLNKKVVKKLVDEIAPRYKDRQGGYTRIIKLGPRKSDGAKMAIIELVK